MIVKSFYIGSIPALLIGKKSEKVFLFVHGLHGWKEEALPFAKVAVPKGYHILTVDLTVERKPWEVLLVLNEVRDYMYNNWKSVSIRANSIGSWFSLQAFQSKKVDQALFVSPILDMKRFIELLPQREDDYYEWVVNNPIIRWDAPTYILRPKNDQIVDERVNQSFLSSHRCKVQVMDDGEHWFHTLQQLDVLRRWEEDKLKEFNNIV